jgi:hypothetical protein
MTLRAKLIIYAVVVALGLSVSVVAVLSLKKIDDNAGAPWKSRVYPN